MSIIFGVSKHFLIKGIGVLIQSSIDADSSSLMYVRYRLFLSERNNVLSEMIRTELAFLQQTIEQLPECKTDVSSVGSLGTSLTISQGRLLAICRREGEPSQDSIDEALSGLIRLLHAIYEKINFMGWRETHNGNNPVYWLKYYAAMYSAQTLFDDLSVRYTMRHPCVIVSKEKNILVHIRACNLEIAALDEDKKDCQLSKIRLVSNHIQAIINEAKLHLEWYKPILSLGCDQLEHYMNMALGELHGDFTSDLETNERSVTHT